MAALNAYYNLFAEAESGEDDYFNPTQSVTRGEFYSFVYRNQRKGRGSTYFSKDIQRGKALKMHIK